MDTETKAGSDFPKWGVSLASNAMPATDDAAKREAVRLWTADPCGPAVTAPNGTREAIEQLLIGRRKYAWWFTQTLAYESSAGLDVLDVGCGQGIDLVEYARAGARVTGIDLTPRHVELARSHIEALGLVATVVQGDAERLPFEDASFDVVSSNGVLHHTPDMPAALREIRRVLRPGGTARIIVYNRRSFQFWIMQVGVRGILQRGLLKDRSMKGVMAHYVETTSIDARPLVRVYSPRQLRKMLIDARLERVQTSIGCFNANENPISELIARHTPLLDSASVRERIGHVAGWYVAGVGQRGR
jgi:ubiquinone/menaquinone biosynthesis C-methylase UbiE